MKISRNIMVSIMTVFLAWGCEDPNPAAEVEEVLTPDINSAPFYFSFGSGAAVDNLPDVTLHLDTTATPSLYSVSINSSAGVGAVVDTSGDFAGGVLDPFAASEFDGGTPVIGANWMDPATYNMTDNHSISTNGEFYYLRLAGYTVVKFQVTKASTIAFDIEYATQLNDSTAGTAVTKTVSYSDTAPADYDLDSGAILEPAEWNMGLLVTPVAGSPFPMPSVIFNYGGDTRVGIASGSFADITSVPSSLNWLGESGATRPLGFGGANEVLTYHPEPPYNHKVIVENSDLVYIVDTGSGSYFKLQFKENDSGIILFEYAAL